MLSAPVSTAETEELGRTLVALLQTAVTHRRVDFLLLPSESCGVIIFLQENKNNKNGNYVSPKKQKEIISK